MIRLTNPETNEEIRISWRHDINPYFGLKKVPITTLTPNTKINTKLPSRTICVITEGDLTNIISRGQAVQYKTDQFNKKIGRKISLERAIEGLKHYLPKTFRARIWDMYKEMQGNKW